VTVLTLIRASAVRQRGALIDLLVGDGLPGGVGKRSRSDRDCQEFRVQAMTMGRKEPSHGTPQSTDYP